MTKSEVVLDLFDGDDAYDDVHFGSDSHAIFLPSGTWKDMDRPNKVTVTIEPGDRLNTEES